MNVHVGMPVAAADFAEIKRRQKGTWATGDYSIIGTTLQIVGERLCETVDLRARERVLDVAAGNGNATLAAARRFAKVTSTDFVASMLVHGRERANAELLPVEFREADAEALPFPDQVFDVALSTFGVMFAPDQTRAAAEIMRVVRSGGRIGLANWTPQGFIGKLLAIVGRYLPPPAGLPSPVQWGTTDRLVELFPGCHLSASLQIFNFRYRSADHWLRVFRHFYGPVNRAFACLDRDRQKALEQDLRELLAVMNRGGDDTLIVPGEYLEAVIFKP